MFVMGLDRHKDGSEHYTVIKVGLAFFRREYRGGPLLYIAFQYHILKELLLRPRTPIYLIGKSFSYMSYLSAVKNFKTSYPRYDCPVIPPKEKRILDEFGESFATFEDTYDPETCVIRREHTRLNPTVIPMSDSFMDNPHIQYFLKLNPDWKKGHCLVTLTKVTWSSLLEFLLATCKRALFKSSEIRDKTKQSVRPREFMSEKEFLQKSSVSEITDLNGLFESEVMTKDEQPSASPRQKRVSYTKTPSMTAGVDRIDAYSEVDINPL